MKHWAVRSETLVSLNPSWDALFEKQTDETIAYGLQLGKVLNLFRMIAQMVWFITLAFSAVS